MESPEKHATAVWAVALVLLTAASSALAQHPAPNVTVHVEPCVPVDHVQLERLLEVELNTSTGPATGKAAPTEIWVGCIATGIELRLQDGVTRKTMARVLPSSSFEDTSSTRLLALAVAEFVVASWLELEVQPKPIVEPIGPRPTSAAVKAAAVVARTANRRAQASTDRNESLSAALTAQRWSSHDALLLGVEVRVVQGLTEAFVLSFAGEFGTAQVELPLGRAALSTASAAVALGLHADLRQFAVYAGPGVRGGVTYMSSVPRDPSKTRGHSFFAPYGGPLLWGRAEYRPTLRVRLALELEFGVATLPAHGVAFGRRVLSLDGVWATAGASIGLGF